MDHILVWSVKHARSLLAAASLLFIGVGFWLFHPGLGLVVPGSLVFGSLAVGQLRTRHETNAGS